ncbi:DUF4327 family protein [Thermostichus vulcanus]|uniref:DUF4327 family protein n=1 Tax=Thermostichus vulcanus str. 'Rupite' TaxID=2813851 RepID=A0ABT0CAK0_THEVL|nr:DUF4327 family protein [Thermostichus vulcanus]MCJ2542744.1 DUF4327 family protein [Thermostichus vulcanus str. 'Rupite']
MPTLQATHYAVEAIQEEARRLIRQGSLRRSEAISHLQPFFSQREWQSIAEELELQDYCPSDPICDLLGGCEEWRED